MFCESDAGIDSAGRLRLFTQELGDRHHGVSASAPAGLLPPVRFRLWLNGREAADRGTMHVAESRVELRGAMDDGVGAYDSEVSLTVSQGSQRMAVSQGRGLRSIKLELLSGLYRATATAHGDTLLSTAFDVRLPLALGAVYSYPNPMRDRTAFLFSLTQPAAVTVDVYTVAGRRSAALSGRFPEGSQALPWDGRDSGGRPVGNGVYLYRVVARAGDARAESVGKLIRLDR